MILHRRNDIVKRPKRKDPHQTYRWSQFSRSYLKLNRLCVTCLKDGITHPSQATDHITPIKEGGAMWDLTNLQALCFKCHNDKTRQENPGWNKY